MYTFDKLAIAAISPLGSALLLGLLALLLALLRRRWAAFALGLLAVVWLAGWSTPFASRALRAHLEGPFPPVAAEQLPQAGAIVLLGGGVSPSSQGFPLPDLQEASDRVWHAARLLRAGRAPLVLVSGGADRQVYASSEAAAMRPLLLDLGVPDKALVLEERSRNTRENAAYAATLLRERGIHRILLVTSALHMARARALFEAQGFEVIPAATDHEGNDTSRWPAWKRWLPDTDELDGSARAIKEWVAQRMM